MIAADRPRFRHPFRCKVCGGRFFVDRLTDDPAKVKTPRCPHKACRGKAKRSFVDDIGIDIAAGRAPGQIGHVQVRAYDTALQMTAEDHGMTDIRDRARPGENSVPALRPDLQRQADQFWSGPQKQQRNNRQAHVDLSGIYGQRATAAQHGQQGARFTADGGSAIAPILQMPGKAPGDSPLPPMRIVASD